MAHLTRRAFLIAAAALAPAAGVAARQTRAITRDEFMRLSQRLVGSRQLDARTGAIYLDALLPDHRSRLARLARMTGAATDTADVDLERTIIECWYTGIYTAGGERRVATHTGALMWTASGTAAPGTCASVFGAWSQPPRPRTNAVSEPRDRSEPAKRRARARVGESEGQSPSDQDEIH